MKKIVTIGLTGGVGTGKSTVARILKSLGAVTIDTDRVAHMMLEKEGFAFEQVVRAFGKKIITKRGEIDRKKLARIVFDGKSASKNRKKLEHIVHPKILESVKALENVLKKDKKRRLLVVEVPLLFEAGWDRYFDKTVTVYSKFETQKKRLNKEMLKRLDAQMPLVQKAVLADFVIDNSSTKAALKRQVKSVYKHLFSC